MSGYAEKVLNLINSSYSHLTAEQVFLEFKKTEPKVVLATVYNNLKYLYENGLIRKISIEGSPDRYDRLAKHDHLVCKKCGKLSDFCFSDLTESLRTQMNDEFLSYELKVFHICSDCRKI